MSLSVEFWITTAIAVVALALSSLSLYLQWKEKRPRLRIAVNVIPKALPVVPDGMGGMTNKDVPSLSIYLSNPSEKPIHVYSVNLTSQHGAPVELREFNLLYPKLSRPFTIEPYRGHEFIVRGQKLADELKKVGYQGTFHATIEVKDEIGKCFNSKPFLLSFSQLLET